MSLTLYETTSIDKKTRLGMSKKLILQKHTRSKMLNKLLENAC